MNKKIARRLTRNPRPPRRAATNEGDSVTSFFAVLQVLLFGALLILGIAINENTKVQTCWKDLRQERTRNIILEQALNTVNKWQKRDAIIISARGYKGD